MSNPSILLIVEGEKMDYDIMKNLLKVYNFNEKYTIYSYNTNIYDLYDKMFDTDEEIDTLEFLQVLKSKEKDIFKKQIFDYDYTDIILVFDYEPHDPKYCDCKIKKMLEYFNESTENGKLYLNYPMVEAFKHLCSFPDDKYIDSKVSMNELKDKKYKHRVGTEAKITQISKYDKEKCDEVIIHNLQKSYSILKKSIEENVYKDLYFDTDFKAVLEKQIEMIKNNDELYILSTCAFYILDYNYKLVFN